MQTSQVESLGQLMPPLAAGMMTERVFWWRPPPHFSEQWPYQEKGETLQLTGQPKVLQDLVTRRPGQALPPWAVGTVTMRVLVLRPELQDLVQVEKGVQAETTQSTGQLCLLQRRLAVPGQSSPPWEAARVTTRVRDWMPVPQLFEQPVQAFHLCSQSMAQG